MLIISFLSNFKKIYIFYIEIFGQKMKGKKKNDKNDKIFKND